MSISPSTASPPKALAVFLAKFDKSEGYKLEWQKSTGDILLSGLEYKALPSGVHQYEANTIYFTHSVNETPHYGLARFRSLDLNLSASNDRDLMKLYSLGVVMEHPQSDWKPHAFANVGWEYRDAIDDALVAFLNSEDRLVLSGLFTKLLRSGDSLAVPNNASAGSSLSFPLLNHPLFYLPVAFSAAGPLLFPLYKAALLRKRILIVNHTSQLGPLLHEGTNRDFAAAASLVYLLSVISIIPNEIKKSVAPNDCSVPLYTVGLNDVDAEPNPLSDASGFVACTGDEILKYQELLYDYTVTMPASDTDASHLYSSSDLSTPIKATFNDYIKFLRAFNTLPESPLPPSNTASHDDASSIRTSTSFLSRMNFGVTDDAVVLQEPLWWKNEATSPMSWSEYIWLAFAWFASAGTTSRSATEQCRVMDGDGNDGHEENGDENDGDDDAMGKNRMGKLKSDLEELVKVVTNFHSLTKKWFYFIQEIVDEVQEELKERDHDHGHQDTGQEDALLGRKVSLELTHSDMVDMELDPYSAQDIEFVKEFVLLYWGDVVEDVDVGIGIGIGFCC